jgi:hypothetical protein
VTYFGKVYAVTVFSTMSTSQPSPLEELLATLQKRKVGLPALSLSSHTSKKENIGIPGIIFPKRKKDLEVVTLEPQETKSLEYLLAENYYQKLQDSTGTLQAIFQTPGITPTKAIFEIRKNLSAFTNEDQIPTIFSKKKASQNTATPPAFHTDHLSNWLYDLVNFIGIELTREIGIVLLQNREFEELSMALQEAYFCQTLEKVTKWNMELLKKLKPLLAVS